MARKQFNDYYLGLDIGTDSVGWAVTDPEYNILRFNGKAMWGIHLFKSGNTAEDRRMHRCSRRRLQRRNQRLALLRMLFKEEISKVDPNFFQRMKESDLKFDDRKLKQKNSIFDDPNFNDKTLHDKYPTIYHLRKDLMEAEETRDIRLVYLAIHHILKNRGHFLFEGLSSNAIPEFNEVFNEMVTALEADLGIDLSVNETVSDIEKTITDRKLTITDKKKRLIELTGASSDAQKAVITLISGGKAKLSAIAGLDEDDLDSAISSISFKGTEFEEKHSDIESAVGQERISAFDLMKQVYDWGILSGLLSGHKYISEAKVAEYEQHKKDLKLLKTVLKVYATEHDNDMSLYKSVMKLSEKSNYSSYVGVFSDNNSDNKTCTQEDFCKHVLGKLKDFDFERDPATVDMKARLENYTFMPKQRDKNNSVLPNDIHMAELERILDNMSRFYPFLNSKDENGVSVKEKVKLLCKFRIPYYIGPLNQKSDFAWAVHSKEGAVYPWNFEEMIDVDKTSERFIENLISDCSYLVGEDVLPKSSLLYSRYMLYNELNVLTVNAERIGYDDKRELIHELFEDKRRGKITKKDIRNFFITRTGDNDVAIEGVDDILKSSLQSEKLISGVIGDIKGKRSMCEDIIRTITIYGDDRKRLFSKLSADYKDILSKEQIAALSKFKFNDWGRLSEKLLTGIYHRFSDGREMNIITAMEQYSFNLMELLSDKYTYKKQIDDLNKDLLGQTDGKITYKLVEDLYCSPAVKHGIWRTLAIIKDIVKVTGHNPKKVFIETTREARDDGRKSSRRNDLLTIYKNAIEKCSDYNELLSSLESTDDARLRGKKLYAYYLQEGRCAYCGEPIDLNDLGNNNLYDMDHIYPQSKTTDDSIRNNMVLSHKTCNMTKTDRYPIDEGIQKKMGSYWLHLKKIGLMTDEKYKRLTRRSEFTEDELSGFIARQLVETSQSVKAVASTLKKVFRDDSEIVYVKAGNVSSFRQDFAERGYYTKSRNVNDYHHAKDAYLNIVVGNVYDTKFTKDPRNMIHSGIKYNLGKMYDKDISRGDEIAWVAGENGTILTVDKYMRRNNILYTNYPYKETGQLFNLQIVKAGNGQLSKKNGMDIEKYGGYNSINGSYFSLVEHTKGKKRIRSLEFVPIMVAQSLHNDGDLQSYFTSKGLVEPDVRIKCVKIGSMMCVDGFRYTLAGRTGDSLIYRCAEQLELPVKLHNYCKIIYNYVDNMKNKSKLAASDSRIDQILNMELYDCLTEKFRGHYGKISSFSSVLSLLNRSRDKFDSLSLDDQAVCLDNILHFFQCNAVNSSLLLIGGPKEVGKIRISKNISSYSSAELINQSTSGLFKKTIDMKSI